jgi:hypothetical protein
MAKDSLFCNYWSYIASGTGSQAEQTFGVLEKLANDSIDTFSGSTGKIFKDEVVINNASGDGFSHNPNGFNFKTYNGSMTMTLNSNTDAKRGKERLFGNKIIRITYASLFRNKQLKIKCGRNLES